MQITEAELIKNLEEFRDVSALVSSVLCLIVFYIFLQFFWCRLSRLPSIRSDSNMDISKQTRDSTDNGVQQDVIVRNLVQRKKISTREVLDIFPALLSVLFAGFTAALRGIVGRDEHEAKTLHLHIGYAILRKATQRFSILQLQ